MRIPTRTKSSQGINKLISLLLVASLFSAYMVALTPLATAAASSATWSTKGDFENNASTTNTATSRNQVSISGLNQTDDAGVTLANIANAEEFSALAAGYNHSLGIKTDGTLWTWGKNDFGQLGNGNTGTNSLSPVLIGAATNWKSVAGGGYHSLAVKTDGTLWSWGMNSLGQLGGGVTRNAPAQVGTDTNWKSVAAGEYHSLGIKTDGTLWAWGFNNVGQLGDGTTTTPRTSPVPIGSATNWKSVAAGERHSLGVKTDGTLWAWGKNDSGQLGNGDAPDDRHFPDQIGAQTNWKSVAAGELHSLAVKTDGTLWSWGWGSSGQLGGGSARDFPDQVGAQTNWKSVAAGKDHSLGLRTNGTLWSWGFNGTGELGDGSASTNSAFPVQVGAATNWKSVAGGEHHSLGVKTDGTLSSWGYNASGQLGDTTTDTRISPVPIVSVINWLGYFIAAYSGSGSISGIKINAGNGNKGNWSTISWNGATPANTLIKFRTRGADTESGLSSTSWSNYYSVSGSSITDSDSQWLEIEATLESTDGVNTSILNDFKIDYDVVIPSQNPALVPAAPTLAPIKILSTLLKLWTKPKVIKPGQKVTIKGEIRDIKGMPVVNKVIVIKANGKVIKRIRTNSIGGFSFKQKPKKTTTYTARYAGDSKYSASSSKKAKVIVKKLKKKAKKKKPKKK